jgi:molybdopterin-containing oxidoreductase family membrane subunit
MCILPFNRTRTILGTCIASGAIVIGMWLERFVIIVPTLTHQRLESTERIFYVPTWPEWFIFIGCFAAFVLLYVIFTKFFPIIAIWEMKEGREEKAEQVHEYLMEHPEQLAKAQEGHH